MNASSNNSSPLQFEVFELDLKTEELRKHGRTLRLQPKSFQLLRLLVTHAGEVVTRQMIIDEVWGRTVVDFDRNIDLLVNRIRETLGDNAEKPRFIETLRQKGYRFICPVKLASPETSPGSPATAVSAPSQPISAVEAAPDSRGREGNLGSRPRYKRKWSLLVLLGAGAAVLVLGFAIRSFRAKESRARLQPVRIAVLPFKNLTGDSHQDQYIDGVTGDIITFLGKTGQLRPVSATSAMAFRNSSKTAPEIARQLDVSYLVEGSMQYVNGRVKIDARLIDQDDGLRWASTVEADQEDVRSNRTDVAWTVATNVLAHVVPSAAAWIAPRGRVDPVANEHYLQGRVYWAKRTPADLKTAIVHFNAAIELAPADARSYAGLADAYNILSLWESDLSPAECFTRARSAADKALELDDTLAEAHTAKAFVLYRFNWDFPGAYTEFQRALQANPSYATAHQWLGEFLSDMGDHDRALQELRQAQDLNPLAPQVFADTATALNYARRYPEAEKELRDLLTLYPQFLNGHMYLASTYAAEKRYDKARVEFEEIRRLAPGIDLSYGELFIHACEGERNAVSQLLGKMELRRRVSAYDMARVHGCLGDRKETMDWLQKAYKDHAWEMVLLKVEQPFDFLRDDVEYKSLMKAVGFRDNIIPGLVASVHRPPTTDGYPSLGWIAAADIVRCPAWI